MWDICASVFLCCYKRVIHRLVIFYSSRESAATLEAESGYTMEAPEVSEFRRHILEGSWSNAEAVLMRLGVTDMGALWVNADSLLSPCYAGLQFLLAVFRRLSFLLASRNILSFSRQERQQLHCRSYEMSLHRSMSTKSNCIFYQGMYFIHTPCSQL